MNLDKIFKPKSIAVIGASNTKGSVGYALFNNIKKYKGKVYPVNIKRSSVQGVRAYKNINDISGAVDLAVVATPAFTVPKVVEDCGQKKVGGLVIISAGFDEAGEKGKELSKQIKDSAAKHKIRIIGPNCLGFISPKRGLNASFAAQNALSGNLAFISQSGALCTGVLDWSLKNKVGFSKFISIGAMLDVGFGDLLEYFEKDPETKGIVVYMETLKEAEKFIKIAKKIASSKPIFVLKVGRSQAGAKAAESHTGSMTGNDEIFDQAFKQSGIARLDSIGDIFSLLKLLNYKTDLSGKNIAVLTNAGGPGVLAADAINKYGLKLAALSPDSILKMNAFLPTTWSKSNPIDIIGDADPTRLKRTVDIILADKNIQALLLLLTPQAMTDPEESARLLAGVKTKKPILFCFIGGSLMEKGRNILVEKGWPIFAYPEQALRSYAFLIKQKEYAEEAEKKYIFKKKTFNKKKNKLLITSVKNEKRKVFNEYEAKEFLKNYHIPMIEYYTADTPKEALARAEKIGYPVVIKAISAKIIHKTEAGSYKLNLKTAQEVKEAYYEVLENARKIDRQIRQVIVEKFAGPSREVIMGIKKDPIFGPVIVFGRGGTEVEVYKDTSLRLLPLSERQALSMIKETKIYKILKGYRGQKGTDLNIIIKTLVNLSYLVNDFPEIKELDINPFMIDKVGGVAVDARIIIN